MFIRSASVIALTLAAPGSAFAPQPMGANSQTKTALHEANLSGASLNLDPELSAAIRSQVCTNLFRCIDAICLTIYNVRLS